MCAASRCRTPCTRKGRSLARNHGRFDVCLQQERISLRPNEKAHICHVKGLEIRFCLRVECRYGPVARTRWSVVGAVQSNEEEEEEGEEAGLGQEPRAINQMKMEQCGNGSGSGSEGTQWAPTATAAAAASAAREAMRGTRSTRGAGRGGAGRNGLSGGVQGGPPLPRRGQQAGMPCIFGAPRARRAQ